MSCGLDFISSMMVALNKRLLPTLRIGSQSMTYRVVRTRKRVVHRKFPRGGSSSRISLDEAPASRVQVFLRDNGRYTLVWTFHHIILDGRSHARVLRDVYEAYGDLCAGVTPTINEAGSFGDHIGRIEKSACAGAEAYWRERLSRVESPTRLPQVGVGIALINERSGHDEISLVLF